MKIFLSVVLLALSLSAQTVYVVEGDRAEVRQALGRVGASATMHSDLLPYHTLATLDERQIRSMGAFRLFPAAPRMAAGLSSPACSHSPLSYRDPRPLELSQGWDGPGLGSAALTYSFGEMELPGGFPPEFHKSEFVWAANEWSRWIAVDFSFSFARNVANNIDVLTAPQEGIHGSNCSFPNVILAHAFLPSDVHLEPFGGDIHVNRGSFSWGTLFTQYKPRCVFLHELGHSLGLYEHSANFTDIMYMYYTGSCELSAGDAGRVQSMYAARNGGGGGPDPGAPPRDGRGDASGGLALTATAPTATTAESVQIGGTVSGGTPPYSLTWTNAGYSGTAASFPFSVPLLAGDNTITITVTDSAGGSRSVSLTVTRTADGRAGR